MHKLNWKFLQRTFHAAKPYWFSVEKRQAWLLLGLLIVLLVGYAEFAVLFNQQSGEFTSALAARNGPRFWHSIWVFFGLILIGVPIDAYYYFIRDKLGLQWRRWLTERYLDRYFRDHGYYRLVADSEIDNPDQRISEDISAFTQQSLQFLLVFANGFLQLVAFSRVLWSLSSYLVLFLVLYAVVGTCVTFGVFGEKMVFLHFTQRKREADFRFGLVRIRENAESIALYHGERLEENHLKNLFGRLFTNGRQIIRWSLGLNFFYYGNSYLAMILPTLIIAPRVLSGKLEVGSIVEATGAFGAILSALTLLQDNIEDLSRFAASVGRLETFSHSLSLTGADRQEKKLRRKRNQKQPLAEQPIEEKLAKIETVEADRLEFENVTLQTPNRDRTLIKNLTMSLAPGERLMIVGASGMGKSSLLRVIAGLWNSGEGTLKRPKTEDMLFLPQHAYMAPGNLRLQLNYPNLERTATEEELLRVLEQVNLGSLAERCGGFDQEFDFEKLLSVGERQRLALARVMLKQPPYVLLDEATSALDPENEAALYEVLSKISTTLVSVSHHPALVKYHTQVLNLETGGGWSLHPAGDFRLNEELV